MSMDEARKQEAVVEAVLFTMGQSVEIRQLAAALECGEQETVEAAERLRSRYDEESRGMQVVRLEDSYQMCTRASYYENLIRVAATPKKQMLTDVVLETLAIIAYKQPVTKADIEKIRGVKSDHAVNRLIEYNLVYEAGRLDAPGRPALFATTEEFLRRFGVGSTGELPEMDLEQREEIRAEVEEELNLKLDGDGRPMDEAAATEQADIGNAEDECAAEEQAYMGNAEDECAATEQADIGNAEDESGSEEQVYMGNAEDESESEEQVYMGNAEDESESKEQMYMGNAEDESESEEKMNIGNAEDKAAAEGQADIGNAEDEGTAIGIDEKEAAGPEEEAYRETDAAQEENGHEMQ